jgi:hypothetical protein
VQRLSFAAKICRVSVSGMFSLKQPQDLHQYPNRLISSPPVQTIAYMSPVRWSLDIYEIFVNSTSEKGDLKVMSILSRDGEWVVKQ